MVKNLDYNSMGVLHMRKGKTSIVCIGILLFLACMAGCSIGQSKTEMAVLREYVGNEISTYDTERLREILNDSSWYESDEDIQFVKPYVFELDGMKYQMDEYTDYVDRKTEFRPIQYGKIGEDYIGFLDTDDRSLMLELYRLMCLWESIPYSYEYCMEHFSEKSNLATLQYKDSDDGKVYTFSEDDTSRLRSLLKLENGWYNVGGCGHKGEVVLTLDNINYYMHMNDTAHSLAYGNTDDSSIYYFSEIDNDDKEIDSEVRGMLEDAVSQLK